MILPKSEQTAPRKPSSSNGMPRYDRSSQVWLRLVAMVLALLVCGIPEASAGNHSLESGSAATEGNGDDGEGTPLYSDSADSARELFERGFGMVEIDPNGRFAEPSDLTKKVRIAGPGIRFWTELDVGGKIGTVPVRSGYRFCREDSVALVLEANSAVQVLALTHSSGDSERSGVGGKWRTSRSWKTANPAHEAGSVTLARNERMRINANLGNLSGVDQHLEVLLVFAGGGASPPFSPPMSGEADSTIARSLRARIEAGQISDAEIQSWRTNAVQGPGISRRENHAFVADPTLPAALELRFQIEPCERRLILEQPDHGQN